jgi:Putative DNA-binding domain
MSSLGETQARFARALRDPRAHGVDDLVDGDGLAPDARLAIYRHHHVTSLTGALRATFPVVHRLVGDGFFRYVAHEFIAAHPPSRPCLVQYGESLGTFLETFPACRDVPYVADVARLEWLMSRAAHADDATPLDLGALRSLDPRDLDGLTLRFEPSLALLDSRWPVDEIWRANQPAADPDATVDAGTGPVTLEIRRLGDDVVMRRLVPAHHAFRRALLDGHALASAATAALGLDHDFDLARALRELFDESVLIGFRVTSRPEEIS